MLAAAARDARPQLPKIRRSSRIWPVERVHHSGGLTIVRPAQQNERHKESCKEIYLQRGFRQPYIGSSPCAIAAPDHKRDLVTACTSSPARRNRSFPPGAGARKSRP